MSYGKFEPTVRAAHARKGEFDATSETHHFGFVVKAVDPGCTLEVQIEEASGQVVRLTTTEDGKSDREVIKQAVLAALDRFFKANSI